MPKKINWDLVRPLVEDVMDGKISDGEAAAKLKVTLRSFRGYLPIVAAMRMQDKGAPPKPSPTSDSPSSSAPESDSPPLPSPPASSEPGAGKHAEPAAPAAHAAAPASPAPREYRGGLRKSGPSVPPSTRSGAGKTRKGDGLEFLD